jgi:hypothetical protein
MMGVRQLRLVFWAAIAFALSGSEAVADYSSALRWFSGLAENERSDIQRGLVLTGDYASLVDDEFGPGTFKAIKDYQRRKGYFPTGELTSDQNSALQAEAGAIFRDFGFDLVRDERSGIAVAVPLTFLSAKTNTLHGVSFSSPGGEVALETLRSTTAGTRFADLFAAEAAPSAGKVITYQSFHDSFFVVSGYRGNRSFYTLYQNAETEAVGYSVSWLQAYEAQGTLLAVLAASYSAPIKSLPMAPEPVEVGPDPPGSIRIGAFVVLKDYPSIIALDGDIGPTSEADFRKAIDARPLANVIVLNSNGGQVSAALLIAYEIAAAHLNTAIPEGLSCYSACAYLYFAGEARQADGNLGVHQIYGDELDTSGAQSVLSIVLDMLDEFRVSQGVISVMLSTPPSDMHVFSPEEVVALEINRGEKVALEGGPSSAPPSSVGGSPEATGAEAPRPPIDLGL